MPNLRVDNRVLIYKGISYQISQISSMKIVKIKKEREDMVSQEPLKKSIPIAIASLFIGFIIFKNTDVYVLGFILLITAGISGFYSYNLIRKKIEENKKDKYYVTFGLSLRMANQDRPIFITPDKDLIFKIRDAITSAMNQEGEKVSVNFDNVNIDITDSEKVEIGNVEVIYE